MPRAGIYGLNQVYNRGGWSHSFVSLVFPKLKVNNNRSTRLQPGFIKGGHIICHILQYNRPIIGGDRLIFFQYWGHVPRKYIMVTPMLYYDKVISALFFNSKTQWAAAHKPSACPESMTLIITSRLYQRVFYIWSLLLLLFIWILVSICIWGLQLTVNIHLNSWLCSWVGYDIWLLIMFLGWLWYMIIDYVPGCYDIWLLIMYLVVMIYDYWLCTWVGYDTWLLIMYLGWLWYMIIDYVSGCYDIWLLIMFLSWLWYMIIDYVSGCYDIWLLIMYLVV